MRKDGTWFIVDKPSVDVIAHHVLETGMISLFSVFMALCYHTDRKRQCFPSYESIMKKSGITSRNTVSRALGALKELGVVLVDTSPGRCNVYQVMCPIVLQAHPAGSPTRSLGGLEEGSGRGTDQDEGFSEHMIYQFIRDMKGMVSPLEERYLQKLVFQRGSRRTYELVEECYLNDPMKFRDHGILPLRRLVES